jgi:hypothetical protein
MPRKRRGSRSNAMKLLEAQAAAWTVLGVRVPMLLAGRMSAQEQHRMVAEKVEAFAESQRAVVEAASRMACRPGRSPASFAAAAAALAGAALDPYHRKVKANAKRLAKPRAPSR